jgi:hypothetical protein
MKKSLIKNLLERRVPQIIGSYFVGSATLILFIDWLITKYGFSENILAFTWFGLISILPSVLILAYFHGAPGKDEWTRVEKFGIPLNILFIAIALFTGYKFNAWQDPPPDHSKVYDNFMVHVSSNQNNIDQLKLTDFWLDNVGGMKYLTGGASSYIDSIYPVDNKELNRIRRYVNVNLNKHFMNYENITINYPDNKKELDIMDNLVSALYMGYLDKDVDDGELQEKKDNELKISLNRYNESLDYFNTKYDTYIDKMYNVKIYKTILSSKGKMLRYIKELEKPKGEPDVYYWTFTIPNIKESKLIGLNFGYNFSDQEGDETPIEQYIYETILEIIEDASFGATIGEVVNILDSNLVTIKLNNLDLIKGTDLIFLEREYSISESGDKDEGLKRYIEDNNIIYNYFHKHPDQIENLDYVSDHTSNDNWLKREKKRIDSLETNFQTIIDNNYQNNLGHHEFRYYLRILNIQDSIATAKITGSLFPFVNPMIGDKINIK